MTHIQRLHGICQILKPYQVNVDDFKLKAFYFSLIDAANDWFLTLPSGSIRTWVQMQGKFLDKYYPATKAKEVRKQLQDIRQEPNETIYDYLERFNRLERSCGTLGMPEKFIIEYLIDGLKPLDKMLLDASAGGSMMNLPLSSIRDLITKAAENAQFRKEVPHQDESFQTKNVSQTETAVNSIPEEIKQLKEMMMQFLQKQTVQVIPCEFCDSTDHKTNACPSNHPGQYQSLEDMIAQLSGTVQQLSTTMHQFQAETKEELSDLKMHISQPAAPDSTHANKIDRLLLQTIQGIQKDVNALTLRSGKTLANKPLEQEEDKDPRLPGEERIRPETLKILEEEATDENEDIFEEERDVAEDEENTSQEHGPDPMPRTETPKISTTLPFPVPARVQKQHVMDKEIFELFSKVEINIPLLEAIKQIPRYAKFLKELCTNRRQNAKNDQELMSMNVSAVMQRKVPSKCGDPGTYTIPCTIGNIKFANCMLDLGASINVLPFSIYSCLKIGPLIPTGLTIQLADRSCKQPEGKIEDVLVQVGQLVFPADFYVLKMENGEPTNHAPILLGRPFLKTARMKIDCGSGMISMEVEGEVFSFDILKAMKHPMDFEEVHALDALDDLVQEFNQNLKKIP
ncbi:unnamed protein product [Rhodiola kirilowii]